MRFLKNTLNYVSRIPILVYSLYSIFYLFSKHLQKNEPIHTILNVSGFFVIGVIILIILIHIYHIFTKK
jgi:hypothetical protein